MRETTVWYLIISNKHGMNVTIHGNPKSAESELVEYCITSWDEEWDGPMPTVDQIIIDTYFQRFLDEWYELEPRTLQI